MLSSHLILCRPLLLLPPIPLSISVFSNESTLHMRSPKYWSFSFSIIPSKEIPGLISFRIDWLDLLAVQGTLKSLLQHHSSKASILKKKFRIMIVKMTKNLENKSEKMQESINKDLEELKNKHTNNTITEIKRHLLLGRKIMTNLSSVQFSSSVVSDSLRPHELQHTRPHCPSPTPRVHSDSCPSSQ